MTRVCFHTFVNLTVILVFYVSDVSTHIFVISIIITHILCALLSVHFNLLAIAACKITIEVRVAKIYDIIYTTSAGNKPYL